MTQFFTMPFVVILSIALGGSACAPARTASPPLVTPLERVPSDWIDLLEAPLDARMIDSKAALPTPVSKRDASVLEAVLAHKIRAEVNRFSAGAGLPLPAPVLTFDRTLAICGLPEDGRAQMGCLSDEGIVQVFERQLPRMRRLIFEDLLTAATRQQLAADLRLRNAVSHPFPEGSLTGVIHIAPEERTEALKRESDRTVGITRLSLPAYSRDGHALVYGSYVCGGLCGEGWLFLLKDHAEVWRVVSVAGLWIS